MENELSRIVDALPGLVWTARPDGHIDLLNQRWCEYTGLRVDEASGLGWQTAIHFDDLPGLLERWRSMLASNKPGEMEARLRRFDGAYRWFLFRASPLTDASGQIVKWCGVNTDIEDRRQAEEALRALLAGEKRLLEMVAWGRPLPVVLDALCGLLDGTAEGCSSSVLLLDRTRARVRQAIAPGLPPSYNESLEGRTVSCDEGQACWSSPILSQTGELLGTLAIYRRETGSPAPFHQALIQQFTHVASIAIERTQSEEALKRSEAFLAQGQRLSSTGTFSWRAAIDELTWSAELYRMFELDQAVPVTLELIASRVHPEDIPWFHEMVDRARGGDSDLEHDHRLLMPDRSVKYVHVVAHGTRDQDGQLEYIGAIQDVTERRLSEAALDKFRSELAHVARVTSLGALTASIAHEVNQPLSGIITNASTCLRMLAADPPNVDGARETARRTIRDGHRAADVITRLRALFVKKGATTELVDLNEATREVIALSSSELQRSRVILRPELADDLPLVTGDRVQLQQVILNLLLNASDAMSGVDDRPRQLVIRTGRDEDDGVRLTVQDAGAGFERRDVDRLFDAFYTTKSGGMGIGLSVSRSIIENHHGRLWAAPNEGPGATFSFSIPRGPEGVTGSHNPGAVRTPAVTDAVHVMRSS
jgi:PAS domain S-box-containing protein